MHDRTGWTKGRAGPKVIKGREYTNLVEFSRPCATCQKIFSIFVTNKIAAGHADSNSFGLKNCDQHRRNKASDDAELNTLRTANVTMREELSALYARDKAQFEEAQALKARLALYELPLAMEAAGNPSDGDKSANAGDNLTFPWQ